MISLEKCMLSQFSFAGLIKFRHNTNTSAESSRLAAGFTVLTCLKCCDSITTSFCSSEPDQILNKKVPLFFNTTRARVNALKTNFLICSWSMLLIPEAFGAMSLNTTCTVSLFSKSNIFFWVSTDVKSDLGSNIAPSIGAKSCKSTAMTHACPSTAKIIMLVQRLV